MTRLIFLQISIDTTVNDVIGMLMDRWKRSSSSRDNWALHEIVRRELGRLYNSIKVSLFFCLDLLKLSSERPALEN